MRLWRENIGWDPAAVETGSHSNLNKKARGPWAVARPAAGLCVWLISPPLPGNTASEDARQGRIERHARIEEGGKRQSENVQRGDAEENQGRQVNRRRDRAAR